jgi:Ni,Fe-hydrogenase I large subunit
MNWDPITRIVGSLGLYTKIDFGNRVVTECHATSSIFRGYSIFMKGKDPRDAHFITSRICGICGDNHATCSVYAQNMAYGIKPPAIAEWITNLGEAAEYMFDHNIFHPPTPWNGTPRDSFGTPGPYEDAITGTPIFEENGPENFKGIDIMRAVRSFDPCLPCGVHMYVGNGKTIETVHSPMFGVGQG